MAVTEENMNQLLDVGVLNATTLSDAFEYKCIDSFLHEDIHLSFHPTDIANVDGVIDLKFDTDGIVIQLHTLKGLVSPIHYLLMPRIQPHMLRDCYHMVKKHIDLSRCSPDGIKALRNAKCHTLAHVDRGYHLTLMVLPACLKKPDMRLFRKESYNIHASELINDITSNFQSLLQNASRQDKCRSTLQKQVSTETNTYHVLPQDSLYIYSLVDTALEQVKVCSFLQPYLFLTKFGQKDSEDFDLTDVVDPSVVSSMSVHHACKLTARDPDIHMLFSRHALQDLVGSRGSLYSILGMHEATNYQTNLDHLPIDLSDQLLKVLGNKGKLTFLQLYVDAPHAHLKMPFKHPVSGVIVTCGLSHPKFQGAMTSRAASYIIHMRDLKEKFVIQLGLRIEQVRLYEGRIPTYFDPSMQFHVPALISLFQDKAIVIPFKESGFQHGLVESLVAVMDHFVNQLTDLFQNCQGVATYHSSWKAFQIELALEELFYGHPLSSSDFSLSVTLGTNTVNANSLTHTRGFIGLAPYHAASAVETPPPLHHWTRDRLQQLRIERIFPLCQTLDAAPAVIGSALVTLLLCDLYKRNREIPTSALCCDKPPGRLAGSAKLELFCEELSVKKSFPAPHTFGRARALLVDAGQNVKECLLQGFLAKKLVYFPLIKFRDQTRSHKAFWNFRDYIVLEDESRSTVLSRVAGATLQVCTEVERRALAYSRTLEKYRENGMTWMERVLQRLPPNMKGELHVNVVTFVSCIAMIMNGDYVDYKHLQALLESISPHVSQATLQKWKILSNITLPKVYNVLIWKLKEDIPYRVQPPPKSLTVKPKELKDEEQPFEDVQAVDEQDDIQPMERSKAMALPATDRKRWTTQEKKLINLDAKLNDRDAYNVYKQKCQTLKFPVRPFQAFRRKRYRLLIH